jgi:hypothetical protein
MKKHFKLLLILFLISAIGLTQFYCSKRTNQSKPVILDQVESTVKSIDPQGEYISADVSIKTNSEGDVIVLANTKDSANEKMYVLQGGNGKPINKSFKTAQVIYLTHLIIINSLENKERYYLGISKPEEKEVLSKLPEIYKSFFSSSTYGYGLVQMKGFLPNTINVFKNNSDPFQDLYSYRGFVNDKSVNNLTEPEHCDAGGAGATSCSKASGGYSCSVSCGSGYYACCNDHTVTPPSCNCKPIK